MPISDLMSSGVELMITGMGIVFIFLTVLVFALGIMSRISHALDKSEHESAVAEVSPHKPDNTALIAVISAAVAKFRSTH